MNTTRAEVRVFLEIGGKDVIRLGHVTLSDQVERNPRSVAAGKTRF